MRTKHTPGPWETSVNEQGQWDVCEAGGGDMVCDIPVERIDAEQIARPIAAAPEMHDVLAFFGNCGDGRCASCNAEIALEGYCGCEASTSPTAEWVHIREVRALLARIDGGN